MKEEPAVAPSLAATTTGTEQLLDQLLAGFERVEDLLPDLLMVIHALRRITTQHLDPAALLALQMYLILKQLSSTATQAVAEEPDAGSAAGRRAEEAAEVLASCCYSLLTSGPIARLNMLEQQYSHEQAADKRLPSRLLAAWQGQLGNGQADDDIQDPSSSHVPYCLQAFSIQLCVMQHRCFNHLHPFANGGSPGANALLLKAGCSCCTQLQSSPKLTNPVTNALDLVRWPAGHGPDIPGIGWP
jgi:hypothetical protein